jgi:predicted transposase/invertase (TIGR01784 family)
MPENTAKKRTLVSFDWALKSILRQKDNFDVLEGFLSDLLNDDITILELLESESNKDSRHDKMNRVDLRAKDGRGREVIIEVQHDSEPDYLERIYYGAAKALVENMKEGYRYKNIKKIISVSIVYWDIMKTGYLARGSMKFEDLSGGGREIPGFGQDIFAEYYLIQPESFDDDIKTAIDEWVYVFKHSAVEENHRSAKNIEKAKEKLDIAKMSEEDRKDYEAYQFNKTINEGVLQVKYDEGKDEGKAENKKETAANFLKMGLTAEQVSQGTGLTLEAVKEIKEKLQI